MEFIIHEMVCWKPGTAKQIGFFCLFRVRVASVCGRNIRRNCDGAENQICYEYTRQFSLRRIP